LEVIVGMAGKFAEPPPVDAGGVVISMFSVTEGALMVKVAGVFSVRTSVPGPAIILAEENETFAFPSFIGLKTIERIFFFAVNGDVAPLVYLIIPVELSNTGSDGHIPKGEPSLEILCTLRVVLSKEISASDEFTDSPEASMVTETIKFLPILKEPELGVNERVEAETKKTSPKNKVATKKKV